MQVCKKLKFQEAKNLDSGGLSLYQVLSSKRMIFNGSGREAVYTISSNENTYFIIRKRIIIVIFKINNFQPYFKEQ